ncbi:MULTISPECIES: O-methyltransferase [Neobacillus]|uniref:tRNA 5-hydroxyuridine methyltransferase n=1 Tax=Neobacillus sedimentimangrovi TaxID=2699460 RepID=A0ABS8QH60_9BACI|nr:O-methyltransferase [Neobacillus sedimentimangrovi]AIM15698.1 SAM-dependent methyltransferase [Bacillus sp. X1(2014)]MCD4838582.1 O-methyltransferase [Neobacillus sedimentimangrovi]
MLDEKLHFYIEGLIPQRNSLFMEMEAYAKEHNVPIMELAGIETMLQLLRIHRSQKILEVGTAIGYSALRMANTLKDAHIITIERDEKRIQLAKEFIQRSGLQSQITLIEGDALEVENLVERYAPFDAIFIDAAKGQYQKFFTIYSKYLNPDGMIITDNVLFKGLVAETNIESKRTRNLVKKIDEFNRWLMSHPDYDSIILPVGDGIAISRRRGEGK